MMLPERYWSKVEVGEADECWPWTGALNEHGYGVTFLDGRTRLAHRAALSETTGTELTTSLKALHSCDNPPCVNPAHLRWGTQKDNARDADERGRAYRVGSKPWAACGKGHDFTPENTYWNRGRTKRRCRLCTLDMNRRWSRARAQA